MVMSGQQAERDVSLRGSVVSRHANENPGSRGEDPDPRHRKTRNETGQSEENEEGKNAIEKKK